MNTFYTSHLFPSLNKGNPKSAFAMIVDAFIVAGITFFSTLSISGFPPSPEFIWAAITSWGITFFTQLAVERGLKFTPQRRRERDQSEDND